MATLKDASITITIPAPIHNAGMRADRDAEFGRNTRASEESMAPVKK
jgi:hypothetical protein